MANESLFSVKRMLKEIKEKLSVSSGGSGGTELTLGKVVEELKSTIETVNTTVTEIKESGGGSPKHVLQLYIDLYTAGKYININVNGHVHAYFKAEEKYLLDQLNLTIDGYTHGVRNGVLYPLKKLNSEMYIFDFPVVNSFKIETTGGNHNYVYLYIESDSPITYTVNADTFTKYLHV